MLFQAQGIPRLVELRLGGKHGVWWEMVTVWRGSSLLCTEARNISIEEKLGMDETILMASPAEILWDEALPALFCILV